RRSRQVEHRRPSLEPPSPADPTVLGAAQVIIRPSFCFGKAERHEGDPEPQRGPGQRPCPYALTCAGRVLRCVWTTGRGVARPSVRETGPCGAVPRWWWWPTKAKAVSSPARELSRPTYSSWSIRRIPDGRRAGP